MNVSVGRIVAYVTAAAAGHLFVAVVLRGVPLLGIGRFADAVAGLTGRPELARGSPPAPLRVALGEAERAPVEGPGPRARLDPGSARRPPVLGPASSDDEQRLTEMLRLFDFSASEAAAPLHVETPGAGTPSWGDEELSVASVPLGLRSAARPLRARFLPELSLIPSAEKALVAIEPREEAGRLRIMPAGLPVPSFPDWSGPSRALRVPEVFVDVLDPVQ